MRKLSLGLLLAAALITWPLQSYACGDETNIGPCFPDKSREELLVGSEPDFHAAGTDQPLPALERRGEEVIDDVKSILTSPFRMDRKDALIVGGLVVSIGSLMVVDQSIQRAFQNNRTAVRDDVADSLETIGSGRNVLIGNVGLIGAGYLLQLNNEGNKLMHTAMTSLEAQLFADGLSGLTKYAVGRARPNAGEGVHSFNPFEGFDKSFPSSHAARSFAVAAVFAEEYPQPIPFLAYTGATVISLSRIYLNEHFASDVLAGAALGLAIGKFLIWRHRNPNPGRGWEVVPFTSNAQPGLGLTVHYHF